MAMHKLMPRDLIRFLIVGIGSNILNYGVYEAIYRTEGTVAVASILGYLIGLINSYYFGKIWAFKKKKSIEDRPLSEIFRFCCVYAVGGAVMSFITFGSKQIFGLDYRLCWLLGAFFAFINNYAGSKWIVFKLDKNGN
jgi:putative flippase GtrA